MFDESCNKKSKVIPIVSALGFHCSNLTLFWFHRALYTQLFLSTKTPRTVFVSINNFNSTDCAVAGLNRHKPLYRAFVDFVDRYFDGEVKIHLFLSDAAMGASEQRNFLARRISEHIEDSVTERRRIEDRYHGEVVVSMFDGDDLTHPQKFEIMDYLYRRRHINGSVLHKYYLTTCKFSNARIQIAKGGKAPSVDAQQKPEFSFGDDFFTTIAERTYAEMERFHVREAHKLLSAYPFGWHRVVAADGDGDSNSVSVMSVLSTVLTHQVLMDNYSYPAHALNVENAWRGGFAVGAKPFGTINNEYRDARAPQGFYANGWPTTTLRTLMANPYDTEMKVAEDINFNLRTVLLDFDYYLFPRRLGYYCTVPSSD